MVALKKMIHLFVAGTALALAALMASTRKTSSKPAASQIQPKDSENPATPNILVFAIDDLDSESLKRMLDAGQLPNIKSKIIDGSVNFENAFVTTSICSPSRATLLTGKFSHNHGVWHVVGNEGSSQFDEYLKVTQNGYLPAWLNSTHFRAFLGKYHLGTDHPEWDYYRPVVGYDPRPGMYKAKENGKDVWPNVYQMKYIGDSAKNAIALSGDRPYFLFISPTAVHVNVSAWHQKADQARPVVIGTPVAFSQFPNPQTNGWRQHLVTVDFSSGAPAYFWWTRDSRFRDSGWGDWTSAGTESTVAPNTGNGAIVGWNVLLPTPNTRRQQLVRQRGPDIEFYTRDRGEGQPEQPWGLTADESTLAGTGSMPVAGWTSAIFPSGAIRQQVVRGSETMGYVSYVRHRHPTNGLFSPWRIDPDWGEGVVFGRLCGFSIIPTEGTRYIIKLIQRRPGSGQFEWWQSGEQVDFNELALTGSADGQSRSGSGPDPLEEGDLYLDPEMKYSPLGITTREQDRIGGGQDLESTGQPFIVTEVHPYYLLRAYAEGNWSPISPGQTYNYSGNFPAGKLRSNRDPNGFKSVSTKYELPSGKPSFNRQIDNSTPFFSPAAWPDLTNAVPGNRNQQDYLGRLFLDRMEQLISLDRMIGEVIDAAGTNTIIIFTSDNGHFNGEHRLSNKLAAQEESIRVPLYVRGPKFSARSETRLVANIDIVPTILDYAGRNWQDRTMNVDGRSLRPLLENKPNVAWRRSMLLEYHKPRGESDFISSTDWRYGLPDYLGLRQLHESSKTNSVYVQYYNNISNLSGIKDIEYYKMNSDPYQLDNLADGRVAFIDGIIREFYVAGGNRCRVVDTWGRP